MIENVGHNYDVQASSIVSIVGQGVFRLEQIVLYMSWRKYVEVRFLLDVYKHENKDNTMAFIYILSLNISFSRTLDISHDHIVLLMNKTSQMIVIYIFVMLDQWVKHFTVLFFHSKIS